MRIKIWIDDLEKESDGKEFDLNNKCSDVTDPEFDAELSCYIRNYVENYTSRFVAHGFYYSYIENMQVCVKFEDKMYIVDTGVEYRPTFKIGKARLM